MATDVDRLHHVGLIVADMGEASDVYQRLGFQLTPLSHHEVAATEGEPPKPLGTANRTTTFRHNFIEILGHVRDDLPDTRVGPWLQRFPGLHICTFNTPDAHALAARLSATGHRHTGVGTLQRMVSTLDGPQMMRVRRLGFDTNKPPEGGLQAAENLTPELLLQERYAKHANGATDLLEALLCVADDDLPETVARYEGYLGRSGHAEGSIHAIPLEIGQVTFVPASKLGALLPGERPPAVPAFVACTIAVSDLSATQHLLEENRVPIRSAGDRIFVPAEAALGGAVIFTGNVE